MEHWKMHMATLHRLIDSRGGLPAYTSVFFRLSLLWTETTGSLAIDQTPYFDIPLDAMQPYQKPVVGFKLLWNLMALQTIDPKMKHVASVLQSLTGLTKSFASKDNSDEGYTVYCITRARVSYLVLHLPRPESHIGEDAPVTVLREIIRLAMLVLLLRLVGFVPSSDGILEHHAEKLANLLEHHDWQWSDLTDLQLWALTLAALTTGKAAQRALLAYRIAMVLNELGTSWDGIVTALHEVAWVDGLFDVRMYMLKALIVMGMP
jgi:hypothetical protein